MRGDRKGPPSLGRTQDRPSSGTEGRSGAGDGDWPRDFGRDGVSGLVSPDRAMRARDVSRPQPDDRSEAETSVQQLINRAGGRR